MAKGRKVPAAQQASLDLPVSFAGVGIGDETARIGVSIDRTLITATKAEAFFCGSRSEIRMHVDPNAAGDQPGQEKMEFAKAENKLESVADCLSFRVSRKKISATLSFKINGLDIGELSKFAKKTGRLQMNRIGDADEKPDEDEGDEGEGDKEAAGA